MGPGRPTYPAPGGPRHGRPFRLPGDDLQRVRGGPPRRPAGALPRRCSGCRRRPVQPERVAGRTRCLNCGRPVRVHGHRGRLPGRCADCARARARSRRAPVTATLESMTPADWAALDPGEGWSPPGRREPGSGGRTRRPGTPGQPPAAGWPRGPGDSCLPRVHPAGPRGPGDSAGGRPGLRLRAPYGGRPWRGRGHHRAVGYTHRDAERRRLWGSVGEPSARTRPPPEDPRDRCRAQEGLTSSGPRYMPGTPVATCLRAGRVRCGTASSDRSVCSSRASIGQRIPPRRERLAPARPVLNTRVSARAGVGCWGPAAHAG